MFIGKLSESSYKIFLFKKYLIKKIGTLWKKISEEIKLEKN